MPARRSKPPAQHEWLRSQLELFTNVFQPGDLIVTEPAPQPAYSEVQPDGTLKESTYQTPASEDGSHYEREYWTYLAFGGGAATAVYLVFSGLRRLRSGGSGP